MKEKDTNEIENKDGKVNEEIDFNKKAVGKPVKHCDNKEVQTKEAKILLDLLGQLKLIYQLDRAKIGYKKEPSVPNKYKYLDLLAKIQVLVLLKERELSKKKVWTTE